MTFIIHELAANPDVQEKLVQEVNEFDRENDGQLDFKSIQSMKYMDMVVSGEWSIIRIASRLCLGINQIDEKQLISLLKLL